VQVTVLGKSPAWQDAAGACSGYLIRHDDFTLLLDCGNGVFAKLRSRADYAAVDAVVITHLHADHFFDLVPYSFALTHGGRPDQPHPQLHGPPDSGRCFAALGGLLGDESLISGAFTTQEYDPAVELALGPLRLRFCEVPHYVRTHAVRISAPGSGAGEVTFGADCGPNEALPSFASGSALMLVEATLREPELSEPRGHLTAREAGEHGRAAAAARLVLTHFSDELDRDHVRAEGSAGYGAEVELAAEGAVFEL
jgi:ribonuclease BN (tRNA processing enzyme)